MAAALLLLVNLLLPLVDLLQAGHVQRSVLLQDEGVSVQTQLLQVSAENKTKTSRHVGGKQVEDQFTAWFTAWSVLSALRQQTVGQKRDAASMFPN